MSQSRPIDTDLPQVGVRHALRRLLRWPVVVGAGSGAVAAVGMGLVLQLGADAMPLIGAFYGAPSAAVGWIAHLFNGAVLGALFVELLTRTPLRRATDGPETVFGLGVGYGAVLGLVSGGILFPVALELAGAATLGTPLLPIPGLGSELAFAAALALGHLVFGAVLGALVATRVDISA